MTEEKKVLFIIYKQRNRREAIYVNNKVHSRNHSSREKAIFRVVVCSLRYPARKAYMPYYSHLWPV